MTLSLGLLPLTNFPPYLVEYILNTFYGIYETAYKLKLDKIPLVAL